MWFLCFWLFLGIYWFWWYGIFVYSCESDRSGDSGTYGHSCDSGDSIESAHSCKSGASGESNKNG